MIVGDRVIIHFRRSVYSNDIDKILGVVTFSTDNLAIVKHEEEPNTEWVIQRFGNKWLRNRAHKVTKVSP